MNRGRGGGKFPYKGYVETLLEIPEIPNFKEYILMLVIEDSEYGNRVPIQQYRYDIGKSKF